MDASSLAADAVRPTIDLPELGPAALRELADDAVDSPLGGPGTAPSGSLAPAAVLQQLLRDGPGLSHRILVGPEPAALIAPLAAVAAAGAAVFGLAIGLQGGAIQAVASAVKLPIVLLASAGLSLPVLHVTCALAGRPMSPVRLSGLVLQAVATGAVVMAGLVPLAVITWLTFSMGSSADVVEWYAYRRFVLAVVGVGALGGLAGAVRLLRHLPWTAALPWGGVLGLTGLQLSWLLRPVIGMPGDTVLLRGPEGTGLIEVLQAIAAVLGA
ncbi:MAG: hypothetical protein H6742_20150 [Alphaproteobacteria bacterium]|nr:hypothetical protein [Alphaproteobacteria bacterium]